MNCKGLPLVLIALALLSGCLPKEPIVNITAAENMRRTPDGRIFISGRAALYELRQNENGQHEAVAVSRDEACDYHAGIAQLHDWIFFVCAKQARALKGIKFADSGKLMAYSLTDGRVEPVLDLSGFQFPNGLDALVQEDAILIADEDFLGKGGVSRIRFDFSGGVPVLLDYQRDWIGAAQQVYAANGVRVHDNAVYLTDIGFVKRVPLDGDGMPETAQILYRGATVLDDLDVLCDGLLVADFVLGRLIYVPFDGSRPQVTPSGLTSPSSVLAIATPQFDAGDILVTEATALSAKSGNQLVRIRRDDLGVGACRNPGESGSGS